MWELIIVWLNEGPEVYVYGTRDEAEYDGKNWIAECGNEIDWIGVRPASNEPIEYDPAIEI